MTAGSDADSLSSLARQFRDFLIQQTNVDLVEIGAAGSGPASLRAALEPLDAALDQLADLASVYADSTVGYLEPLVLPVAALTGAYMLESLGGQWLLTVEDGPPAEDSVGIIFENGDTIDLISIVRVAILSGPPNLAAMVRE